MKKLQKFGNVLSRNEMKSIAGGFHQCTEDYVCGPPCPPSDQNTGQSMGWYCEGGGLGGACKPMYCLIDPV
jgi:hypothetical protein